MRRKQTTFIIVFIGLLWIAVIFLLSSQAGNDSHETSGTFTRFVVNILYPDFEASSAIRQAQILDSIEPLLRKVGHYFEYSVLGVLCFLSVRSLMIQRIVRRKTSKAFSKMRCGLFAFYPCILIAAADEIIQSLVGGRNSSTADVLLDCAGILTGLILCAVKTRDIAVRTAKPNEKHRNGGGI